MQRMTLWVIDLAGFAGASLITVAAWRYSETIGIAVAGSFLLTLALAAARSVARRSNVVGSGEQRKGKS